MHIVKNEKPFREKFPPSTRIRHQMDEMTFVVEFCVFRAAIADSGPGCLRYCYLLTSTTTRRSSWYTADFVEMNFIRIDASLGQ